MKDHIFTKVKKRIKSKLLFHRILVHSNFTSLTALNFLFDRYATIWALNKSERKEAHRKASDIQRMFMYLPFFVWKDCTNIMELLRKETIKYEKKLHLLNHYFAQFFEFVYKKSSWYPFLNDLKFIDKSDTSATQNNGKSMTNILSL